MPDTPLGQIVRIRSEDDKKIIEKFGPNEKRIRQEWSQFRSSQATNRFTEQDKVNTAEYFEKLFSSMFGAK